MRAALTDLCAPERATLSAPFRVDYDGRDWDCATNGSALVMFAGATFEHGPKSTDVAGVIREPLEDAIALPLADLREWCDFPVRVQCPGCNGKLMQVCDMGHEHDCEVCDHDGKVRQVKPGAIGGLSFDRLLILRYTPESTEEVRVSVYFDGESMRIDGDGWIAIIMARREPIDGLPVFPQKELPPRDELP